MKRVKLAVLFVIMVLAILVVCTKKPNGPEHGVLVVLSKPAGAMIQLNDQDTGLATPYTFNNMATGSYQVKLFKNGYEEWSQTVVIKANQTTEINVDLEIASCIIGDTTETPTITITSQPGECPYGSWAPGPITGYVNNVDTSQCFVALYAETDNFYVQPWTVSKKTYIHCDGKFSNGTHCGHHYVAILAKNSWDPPNTMTMLPQIGGDILAIARAPERRITFAGETWIVKSSLSGKIDPGPNYWSDQTGNVWVDGNGYLHLKITNDNGKWTCAEIYSEKSFGHGDYTWYVASRIDQMDPNVVLGLFVYEYINKEIDIEFSRWGVANNVNNSQYVIQPWNTLGNRYQFNTVLTDDLSSHRFAWTANSVEFTSWLGHDATPPQNQIIQHWLYTGSDNPLPGQEKARMNLWLFYGQAPTNSQEVEIIITSFTFKPDTGVHDGP